MIISLTTDVVELLDAHNFTALSVHTTLTGDAIAAAVADLRLGSLDDDGKHIWIAKTALVDKGRESSLGLEWEQGLDRMYDYARTKGWVDDERRVRAHIQ